MEYSHKIKLIKKDKYRNFLSLNKRFYSSYLTSRKKIISKLNIDKNLKKNFFLDKKDKLDHTFIRFLKIFEKFKNKKTLSNIGYKQIYIFYKKFETNLILSSKYDNNFYKISKNETNFNSYIILGFFLKNLKVLNHLQRINCLLKINDHLILKKFKPKNKKLLKIYLKNIEYEITSIKRLNQK
tara:strand:- start:956 stop:1504 length:549 start_codon:yes stop_codon:yes gene_type:complete